MISIHSLWALADQVGFGPSALLVKIGEKAITDAGGKAAAAVGQRLAGSAQAVLSHWAARMNDGLGRSPELSLRKEQVGFRLLQSSALLETDLDGQADRLAAELGLLSDGILGISRSLRARALLVSTGIVRQEGERLSFIHESFRSYLRSEAMAREYQPQAVPWRVISPFREGWETIAFTIEIWRRDGWDTTSALEDLLAFGDRTSFRHHHFTHGNDGGRYRGHGVLT
jgi:hypothetical protein